jgi:hypothetical protein
VTPSLQSCSGTSFQPSSVNAVPEEEEDSRVRPNARARGEVDTALEVLLLEVLPLEVLPLEVEDPFGCWLPTTFAGRLGVASLGVAWGCNRGHFTFLHLPVTKFLQTSLMAVGVVFVDVLPVDAVSEFGVDVEMEFGTEASLRLCG